MLVKVLKAFPYAHDHHHVVTLEKGAIVDIDEGVLEGLAAEKLIGEASDDEIEAAQSGLVVLTPPVEIPPNWRELAWFQLQALARKLGAGPKVTKAAATAIVESELSARG
jgi:hypothetical protein